MGLCKVCDGVDFETLQLRPRGGYFYPPWGERAELARKKNAKRSKSTGGGPGHLLYERRDKSDKSFGYQHHSRDKLKKSAVKCPLCARILEAVHQFGRNLHNDPIYQELYGPEKKNYRIYLTSRASNIDGFLIWTKSRRSNWMFFLGAVGFCVNDNSVLRNHFKGRPVQIDPSLRITWDRAQQWITNCDNNHAKESPRINQPMPKRVLDVGNRTSLRRIKLFETNGAFGTYTTLSWRWGAPNTQLTTKKATIDTRIAGIPWRTLPRTFQDAVTITRNLGYQYLWIDALCIIQDDLEDKADQIGKMSDVYSNSYLTISASAGKDATVGCFASRRTPKYGRFTYTLDNGTADTVHAFLEPFELASSRDQETPLQDDILSSRGWTFQERVLSPRSLYFAKGQMYFECMTEFVGENGFRSKGRVFRVHDQGKNEDIISQWNNLIDRYSTRDLTMFEDKLPAVSGLAKRLNTKLNQEYLAGIWRQNVLGDILWTPKGSRKAWKPFRFRSPSWSWASIDGTNEPMRRYRSCEKFAVLNNWRVTPKAPGNDQFGQVSDGYLKISAPLIPITIISQNEVKAYIVKVRGGKRLKFACSLDYTITFSRVKRLRLYALVIGRDTLNSPTILYPSLIVTPIGGQKGHYCRLGMMLLDEKSLGKYAPRRHGSRTTIYLI